MDCLIQEIRVADLDLALVHVSGFGDCQIIGFPRIEDEADHLESGFCQNWMIPIQRLLDALLGVFRFGRGSSPCPSHSHIATSFRASR